MYVLSRSNVGNTNQSRRTSTLTWAGARSNAITFGWRTPDYVIGQSATVSVRNTTGAPVTLSPLPPHPAWEIVLPPYWTGTPLPHNQAREFTIRPRQGLRVGTYDHTFVINNSTGNPMTFDAFFTVGWMETAEPTGDAIVIEREVPWTGMIANDTVRLPQAMTFGGETRWVETGMVSAQPDWAVALDGDEVVVTRTGDQVGSGYHLVATGFMPSTLGGWDHAYRRIYVNLDAGGYRLPPLETTEAPTGLAVAPSTLAQTSFSVNAITAPGGWTTQYALFAADGSTVIRDWAVGTAFTGLTADTAYVVRARFAPINAATHAMSPEATLNVRTSEIPPLLTTNAPAAPVMTAGSLRTTSFAVNAITAEAGWRTEFRLYAADGVTPISDWVTSRIFSGLTAETTYVVRARFAAINEATHVTTAASGSLVVTTSEETVINIPGYPWGQGDEGDCGCDYDCDCIVIVPPGDWTWPEGDLPEGLLPLPDGYTWCVRCIVCDTCVCDDPCDCEYPEWIIVVHAIRVASIAVGNAGAVEIDATRTLTATVLPENARNRAVVWTSSDAAIATVNAETGVVTGVAAGTVTITATAADGSGVVGTATVTVGADGPTEPIQGQFRYRQDGIGNIGVLGTVLVSREAFPNLTTEFALRSNLAGVYIFFSSERSNETNWVFAVLRNNSDVPMAVTDFYFAPIGGEVTANTVVIYGNPMGGNALPGFAAPSQALALQTGALSVAGIQPIGRVSAAVFAVGPFVANISNVALPSVIFQYVNTGHPRNLLPILNIANDSVL
ncbi:MAG: Ig-like domain-containing protein [Oscillospiraceae bacterium]|nr:Ig-like domain-containing protein [Oscillospiraceae bacterium]